MNRRASGTSAEAAEVADGKARIERVDLHRLKAGQSSDFFAMLCEKTKRTTKDGKPFYSIKLRDAKRTASSPVWGDSPVYPVVDAVDVGCIVKVRGIYQEHKQYGPQIEIHNLRAACEEDRADGYDPDAFSARTKFDVDELFAEIMGHAESIEDRGLRKLVVHLLKSNETIIRTQPAACRYHHAYRGGYLEHTLSVTRTGIYLAEKYREYYADLDPPLNRDLVVAGCILHDIGKMTELAAGVESAEYTLPGMLVGHIVIGRDMVRESAAEVGGVDPELLLYLEHIILSHQGTPEWGSPKEPMFPEAFLVHHADDIDAKMNMFVDAIEHHEGTDLFSQRSPALARRVLVRRQV